MGDRSRLEQEPLLANHVGARDSKRNANTDLCGNPEETQRDK